MNSPADRKPLWEDEARQNELVGQWNKEGWSPHWIKRKLMVAMHEDSLALKIPLPPWPDIKAVIPIYGQKRKKAQPAAVPAPVQTPTQPIAQTTTSENLGTITPEVVQKLELELSKWSVITHGGCMAWNGFRSKSGAPMVHVNGKTVSAAKAIAIVLHGAVVDADHFPYRSCGNSRCVHPNHIRMTTKQEYGRRMKTKPVQVTPEELEKLAQWRAARNA